MEEIIKQLRIRLRLAMDGAVAASMRKKGVAYKLNFGVTLPRLKEIAAHFTPDAALAEYLWQQDVREFKILATLLYPAARFTARRADEWVEQIKHVEIAEQFCANLMQNEPYAPACAAAWTGRADGEGLVTTAGYLLYARLFMLGASLTDADAEAFLRNAAALLHEPFSLAAQAAANAVKRYGRQSEARASEVLKAFDPFRTSGSLREQEIYEDLKFEFDYSR